MLLEIVNMVEELAKFVLLFFFAEDPLIDLTLLELLHLGFKLAKILTNHWFIAIVSSTDSAI